mgnify:CR=1 FL=1
MTEHVTLKTKRWVRVVLILSLGLNIACVGMIGGAIWKKHAEPHGNMRAPMAPTASMYIRALDEDGRRKLGEKLRDQGRKDQRIPKEIRQGFEQALELLRADTFDQDAFSTVMTDHARHADDRLVAARTMFLSHLATLSKDERAAYADRLEKTLRQPRKKRD